MKMFQPGDEFTLGYRIVDWLDQRLQWYALTMFLLVFLVFPAVLVIVAWLRG